MGCDIHFYVEVRKDGKWTTADTWETEDDHRNNYDHAFYSGRNYNLFSLLADVRSEEGALPFSEPRGIPADSCPEIKAVVEQWDTDGHSHSHFTLAELMAQDWELGQRDEGSVALGVYVKWNEWARKNQERPDSWCGWTSCKTITEDEAAVLIKSIGTEKAKEQGEWGKGSTYVRCSWSIPRHKIAGEFLSKTMPKLWKLGKPEDVRCVFFFDN